MATKTILQTAAGNQENQDRGGIIGHGSKQILIVADGAGGISGGTEAAEVAVEYVRLHARLLDGPESCASIFRKMDQAIAEASDAGETTCALAVLSYEQIFGASVGDSGVWLIGIDTFVDLTRTQYQKPLIGSGAAWPVPFARPRVAGELLLLATDGLLNYAHADRIAAACRGWNAELSAPGLIDLVQYPSGALPDDVTFVLARL
jgi:serine/threonine protein phosphatase PrpC